MKAKIQPFNQQPLWEGKLQLRWLSRALSWQDSLRPFISATIIQCVPLDIRAGLSALTSLNKRQVVGSVLLVVGVFGIFAHQFFPQSARDYSWYYLNWYYFIFTIRPWLVLILWSAGFILFVPGKYSLSFVPFSLVNATGWGGLMHYSFFVDSNESFHTFPQWSIVIASVCLGFAVIKSLDYLLYWVNHKCRGNHARFAGVAEMNLSPNEKETMFRLLAKEYRDITKMI